MARVQGSGFQRKRHAHVTLSEDERAWLIALASRAGQTTTELLRGYIRAEAERAGLIKPVKKGSKR